jgi:hypothetical protein
MNSLPGRVYEGRSEVWIGTVTVAKKLDTE